MALFRVKATVQAITFDELVAHGKATSGAVLSNGMPWKFKYQGKPITRETDDCYLVPGGVMGTQRMGLSSLLVYDRGELVVLQPQSFYAQYEPLNGTRADVDRARAQLRESLHRLINIHGADGTSEAEYRVMRDVDELIGVASCSRLVTPCAAHWCPLEGSIEVIKGSGDKHCDFHAQQLRTLLSERYTASRQGHV